MLLIFESNPLEYLDPAAIFWAKEKIFLSKQGLDAGVFNMHL